MLPSYLAGVIIVLLIWLVFYILNKSLRVQMLIVGILIAPFVILDVLTVPTYWNPQTFFNLPVGIEGFAFTFLIAGIASVSYEAMFHKKYKYKTIKVDKVYPFFAAAIASFAIIYLLSLNVIYFFILSFAFMAIIIVKRRKALIPNAFFSSLFFGIIYFSAFYIWLHFYPESINWWNKDTLSGINIAGVPFEEMLFALGFGLFVGPLYEYLTDARL
jgi:hypothetical protein